MSGRLVVLLAALACGAAGAATVCAQDAANGEVITAIRVHGNHTTPDDVIVGLTGVHVGDPVAPDLVASVKSRLDKSERFRAVDVRKRYASIADASAVVLVVIVEERAGVTVNDPQPGPWRRFRAGTMWLPLLAYEDGYGWTYGARFTFPDALGHGTRVSVPLSWGGERRASMSIEHLFERGPLTRIVGSAGVTRRENPAYGDTPTRRTGASLRIERAVTPSVRIGAEAEAAAVRFGALDDRIRRVGVDVRVDTRLEPLFPRRAVFFDAGVARARYGRGLAATRTHVDARGYLGLPARFVLAVRGQYFGSSDPLPSWDQPLLGGSDTLRGFRLGAAAGDQLAAVSAEVRRPLSSPLAVVKMGWAVFTDAAAVYAAGARLSDTRFERSVGAGVFLAGPIASLRIDVAHGLSSGTRAHVGLGVQF